MNSGPTPLRRVLGLWPWALGLAALSSGVVYARTRPVLATAVQADTGPVLREAIGTGTVESEAVVQLAFTVTGRLASLSVHEGSLVQAGEVVATLEASQESRRVELARSGVAQSAHAVSRSAADIARAKSVLDAALLEERRVHELLARGAASPSQRDAVDERVARARAELAAAEAGERQSRASVAVARESERLERVREDETRIVSPIEGVVVKRLHEPGDVVGPGSTVLVVASHLERIQSHLAPAARRATRLTPGRGAIEGGVSAIVLRAQTAAQAAAVHAQLTRWDDVSVYTTAEQRSFLLEGVVDKARRQIGLFRALLVLVSGIVVSLVVFNMTLAKTHEIALLKLMGARLSLVVGMIVQQAVLLAVLGYGVAVGLSVVAFPHFPRRVVVGPDDLWVGLGLSVLLSLVASLAAVKRALSIPPTTILAG